MPKKPNPRQKASAAASVKTVAPNLEKERELARRFKRRPDMTWRDHLVMLLYIGAEIEHSLMVQYLYSAYSIEGDHHNPKTREMVERWRASILSVAREEMGHLITVQNLLVLLGAPINIYRRDFPWTTEYYPYPPRLEPFSRESLACYIFAEMPRTLHPKHDQTAEQELTSAMKPRPGRRRADKFRRIDRRDVERIVGEIIDLVKDKVDEDPHRVGALYHEIIELIQRPDLIPDSEFHEANYDFQASWDDWGRGYGPEPYHLDVEGGRDPIKPGKKHDVLAAERDAVVMVERMASRAQAVKVLKALSGQGEAPHLGEDMTGEPSHFDRFVEIYAQLRDLPLKFRPARTVPTNPTTRDPSEQHEGKPAMGDATSAAVKLSLQVSDHYTFIEAECARRFAELFNLRYRMMLTYLAHSFRLARAFRIDLPSPRAMVMHRVFGEMYNLKSISALLVRLPLRDEKDERFAAPPFEMPYSLILPPNDRDVWRQHLALLDQAKKLCESFLAAPLIGEKIPTLFKRDLVACGGEKYLRTLIDLDRRAMGWISGILAAEA
jgi:hypothetical protein